MPFMRLRRGMALVATHRPLSALFSSALHAASLRSGRLPAKKRLLQRIDGLVVALHIASDAALPLSVRECAEGHRGYETQLRAHSAFRRPLAVDAPCPAKPASRRHRPRRSAARSSSRKMPI